MTSFNTTNALTVNGSGLGTGVDVTAMVEQRMSALRMPEQLLKDTQTGLSEKSTVLNALNLGLASVQTSVQAFTDITGQFSAKRASSSDDSQLTAAASPVALSGSHSILISKLATNASCVTRTSLADSNTVFGEGAFTLQVGVGAPITVTVDDTNNTLKKLAASINSADLGVTASIVTDASGARLSLLSQTDGALGDLNISSNSTGIVFDKKVAGANASLIVDGIEIESQSNSVATVIPGVTLNLATANPSKPITLTIAPDTSAMTSAVTSFVNNYNTLIKAINNQFQYDPSSGNAPSALSGDSSLQLIQQQLYSATSYSVPANNGVVNLESLGISMNNDGTLTVNSSKLDTMLSSQPSAVLNFFQGVGSWGQNFNTNLYKMNSPMSGALYVELTGIDQEQNALSSHIEDVEARLVVQQQALTAQYSHINTLLEQLPAILAQIRAQLGQ